MATAGQSRLDVEVIRQYPGGQQVARKIKVQVPGKHFPALQAAEQKQSYSGTAVENVERHSFPRHAKAWGAAYRQEEAQIHPHAARCKSDARQRRLARPPTSIGDVLC